MHGKYPSTLPDFDQEPTTPEVVATLEEDVETYRFAQRIEARGSRGALSNQTHYSLEKAR